jgi:uncharacterized membrane protein
MFDLISLISIALAIAALASARGARSRLETEIAALKEELKRIEALPGGPVAREAETAHAGQVQDERGAWIDAPKPEPGSGAAVQEDAELEKAAREKAVAEIDPSAGPEPVAEPLTADMAASAAEAPAKPATEPAKRKESFESKLAARWTVWVGGLALAFAGIFAVKYSIDQAC